MAAKLTAGDVIHLLGLAPLPGEGGSFRRTRTVPDPDHPHAPLSTSILYLVTPDSWSGLHMLDADELFHLLMGDPCRMVVSSPQGEIDLRCIGPDRRRGCVLQSCVVGGMWQGTKLEVDGDHGFALFGATMMPGFRPDRFTLATDADLLALPESAAIVLRPYLAPAQ